jgi:putative CocE/NonD family hydrolase
MSHTSEKEQLPVFGTYRGPAAQYEGTTTQSLFITMRDGVRLAAEVVLPANLPPGTKIPALLSQTRYWRAMELRAPFKWFLSPQALDPDFKDFQPFFASHGYALVIVDVRGTGASFGTWPHPWSAESVEDAREIVDWIVAQPWSDGQVGAWGISYLGTTAELLVALHHPAVKAVIPMFNHPDAYTDIAFPGGLFNQRFIQAWGYFDQLLDRNVVPAEFGVLGRLVVTGVKPVDDDRRLLQAAIRDHEANGSAYDLATQATCRDDHLAGEGVCMDDIAVHRFQEVIARSATVTCGWGSWLDAGTADAVIRRFLTFDNARRAVIGAWEHGGRYNASPYRPADGPSNPPLPGQWQEMLRFFDAHLRDGNEAARSEKVLFYYTLGEEAWHETSVWPPEGTAMQRWYLADNHQLWPGKPQAASGADTYPADFEASSGDYNRWWEMGALEKKSVTYGHRSEADRRLLTYTSRPVTQDTEITGYPVVTLYVTSTETDGAFYVYLEDVDEQGRVTYVTEGQLRALHRKVSGDPAPYALQVPYHSFKQADAMPLVPGEVAELTFGLHPTSALVRKGHCLRITIAAHDHGTFGRVPAEGMPVITVARNREYASFVDLPVVVRRAPRGTGAGSDDDTDWADW